MTEAGAVSPPRPPTPPTGRVPVRRAPRDPRPPPTDPRDPVRKWIAYLLIGLLIGVIAVSGAMVIVTFFFCQVGGTSDVIFRWMSLSLGPVAALAGSAVTFYMERSRR